MTTQPYYKAALFVHILLCFGAVTVLFLCVFSLVSLKTICLIIGPLLVFRVLSEYGYRYSIQRLEPPGSVVAPSTNQ